MNQSQFNYLRAFQLTGKPLPEVSTLVSSAICSTEEEAIQVLADFENNKGIMIDTEKWITHRPVSRSPDFSIPIKSLKKKTTKTEYQILREHNRRFEKKFRETAGLPPILTWDQIKNSK